VTETVDIFKNNDLNYEMSENGFRNVVRGRRKPMTWYTNIYNFP